MTQTPVWNTESIRFSLLGVKDGGRVSWKSLMGKEPESVTNRPSQQISLEEGPYGNGRLVITSQPGRIDITITAMPIDHVNHPTIGDFAEISEVFEKQISKIKFPAFNRLAIGVTLTAFPESAVHSAELIKKLVPSFNYEAGVSDVSIQFNRPKKLRISGIVLNRLCKFSQMFFQTVQYTDNEPKSTKLSDVVQFELDMNTGNGSTLPSLSSLGPLITAVFTEARLLVGELANG